WGRFLLGAVGNWSDLWSGYPPWLGGDLGRAGEERRADRCVGSLVDDLETLSVCDQDRRAEVRTEVFQRFRRPNSHVDGRVAGVVDAQALGLVVGELDLEAREEPPRVGERQRQVRVVERVQPDERRVLFAGEEGVAMTAEADEPVRELDDGVVRDLERA